MDEISNNNNEKSDEITNFKKSKTIEYNDKANEPIYIANESNNNDNINEVNQQANANNIDTLIYNKSFDENSNDKIAKSKSCIQRRVTFDKLKVIEVESYKFYNLSNTISPNFDEYSSENKSTRFKMIECCCIIM